MRWLPAAQNGPGRRKASTPKSQLHCVNLGKCCPLSGPSLMWSGLEQRFSSLLMGSRAASPPGGLETGPLHFGTVHSSGAQPPCSQADRSPVLGSNPEVFWSVAEHGFKHRIQAEQKDSRVAGRAASLDWSWQEPSNCLHFGR